MRMLTVPRPLLPRLADNPSAYPLLLPKADSGLHPTAGCSYSKASTLLCPCLLAVLPPSVNQPSACPACAAAAAE
jgi:hypothetical protein